MAAPFHKSKTSSVLAFWKGFSEELQKISAATGIADVTKAVKKVPTGMPKLTSKPVVKEPALPSAGLSDLMSSSRTIPPPPVTAGGN